MLSSAPFTVALDKGAVHFHVDPSMVAPCPRYAVIVPACDEAACIVPVLAELRDIIDMRACVIAVGVNGSSDATAELARSTGAIVAETAQRGYGHGCQAAIVELERRQQHVDAYIFFAADGANDPREIAALIAEHQRGAGMVLGCRTRRRENWTRMNFHYVIANRLFGLWCGLMSGRVFSDLGPLRLIEADLFAALRLQEWTYGWTIEAQIRAALLGASIAEISVRERQRIAGEQKVSHVSWWRTFTVGLHIVAAGFRARRNSRAGALAQIARPPGAKAPCPALAADAGVER